MTLLEDTLVKALFRKKYQNLPVFEGSLQGWRDSNPRHRVLETRALTGLSYTPIRKRATYSLNYLVSRCRVCLPSREQNFFISKRSV